MKKIVLGFKILDFKKFFGIFYETVLDFNIEYNMNYKDKKFSSRL